MAEGNDNPWTFSKEGTTEFLKEFTKVSGFSAHREALMASYRKNLEALTRANQIATEVMKALNQLQTEYLRSFFKDINGTLQEYTEKMAPAEEPQQQTDKVRKNLIHAVNHSLDIVNMVASTQKEIQEIFQERVKENLEEVKKMASNTKTTH